MLPVHPRSYLIAYRNRKMLQEQEQKGNESKELQNEKKEEQK